MTATDRSLQLPATTILVTGVATAAVMTADGELLQGKPAEFRGHLTGETPAMVCHLPSVCRRMGIDPVRAFDILELFAFVRPAEFCVPTPRGLMAACDIPVPERLEDHPMALLSVARHLLEQLMKERPGTDLRRLAWAMTRAGWLWGESVMHALGLEDEGGTRAATSGLDAWRHLPEWKEQAPPPPPGSLPVDPGEARQRLSELLGSGAEARPSQADFTSAVARAFTNPESEDGPQFVLAEAGTGVGKTLGYIAPASLWAERNEAPVWLSTYTRNLQHQIEDELTRLYPDDALRNEKVVLRKGRENYICLLNFEEAVRAVAINQTNAVPLGLMARWILHTRAGDLNGGDFPSWLADLLGRGMTLGLSDRRGECIHSACSHHSKCFIENAIRRSRRADLVVANHALVMVQAARGALDTGGRNSRFVFDEGHHVFDAADSAFSAHLSGWEMWELRRWLRGHEGGRGRGRARGIKARCEDLVAGDDASKALDDLLAAAGCLAAEGWPQRMKNGQPNGSGEALLAHIYKIVYARAPGRDGPYSLEVEAIDPPKELLVTARDLHQALEALGEPAKRLRKLLLKRLDEEADELDSNTRARIELVCRSLENRCEMTVAAWCGMLESLAEGTPVAFTDWYAVDRVDGRDMDVGLHRHWLDPTQPFATVVAGPAQGVLVTSATLTDGSGDVEADWRSAEARTGAEHLLVPAVRARVPSPFNYTEQTRVLVVNDVRKDDLNQVAAAYRELMKASGGGALGLFTAISRLRAVYDRIAAPLEDGGLPLYAQHVDRMNLPTLIDIFRLERDACLLGTDAVRDGVDVPGDSLRMIVFDRVPWPRPTILHKARRSAFGSRKYDEMLTRLKLKQAFGRLVRRADDRGIFVMLDSMMPSRLGGAFPEGVEIERIGLAEAIAITKDFFPRGA